MWPRVSHVPSYTTTTLLKAGSISANIAHSCHSIRNKRNSCLTSRPELRFQMFLKNFFGASVCETRSLLTISRQSCCPYPMLFTGCTAHVYKKFCDLLYTVKTTPCRWYHRKRMSTASVLSTRALYQAEASPGWEHCWHWAFLRREFRAATCTKRNSSASSAQASASPSPVSSIYRAVAGMKQPSLNFHGYFRYF